MQDSNIPKFLSFDIPLFNDIIEDLFPGIMIPERDTIKLKTAITKKCE
jgi:dynein heavy chain